MSMIVAGHGMAFGTVAVTGLLIPFSLHLCGGLPFMAFSVG